MGTSETKQSDLSLLLSETSKDFFGALGARGLAKSVYYSLRHTGSPTSLVLSRKTSVDISRSAMVDVERRFLLGTYNTQMSHHSLGGCRLYVGPEATLEVSSEEGNARICSDSLLNVQGRFSMGASYINGSARIFCVQDIEIGDNCAIAWDVTLMDNDGGHQVSFDGKTSDAAAPIRIEDDVWIGHNVTVQKGVTIGEGAVVSSNTLVNRDVPSGSLAAGVPCQIISEDADWW